MMVTPAAAAGLARVVAGEVRIKDLEVLLATEEGAAEAALLQAAEAVRRERVGEGVHLRALIEFSNYCGRTCAYCGLRGPNAEIRRYRLRPEEIMAAARQAAELGYQTVVLQSGEDPWYTRAMVSDLVRQIKAEFAVAVTLCLGERPAEDYAAWRRAGADRYLLRIETSDPEHYAALHPGMSYANRLECLQTLKRLGYQVGSGVLVGLPGQTPQLLARDLLFLRELQPDMVGLGPFIPNGQTPLGGRDQGPLGLVLRMMALARLLMPECYLVATTALGTIDPLGREKGLVAGANVMMPNATPQRFRADYAIYPNKICIDEEPEHCRGCIERRLAGLGRTIAGGYGHGRGGRVSGDLARGGVRRSGEAAGGAGGAGGNGQ